MRRILAALLQAVMCVAFCSDVCIWAEDAGGKAPATQLAGGTILLSHFADAEHPDSACPGGAWERETTPK